MKRKKIKFTDEQIELIFWYIVEDLTRIEAAKVLNISPGAVSLSWHRIIFKIKKFYFNN